MQVSLQLGEVLYVPPFWVVHSEALGQLSVSLDVLSASHEQMLLTKAHLLPLPFAQNQTADERVVAAQVGVVVMKVPANR